MEPVLAALARYVARSPAGAVPGAVRDRAPSSWPTRRRHPWGQPGAGDPAGSTPRPTGRGASATVLGCGLPLVEPWWAIVANGLAGTMLELDEGNRFARGHPGVHVVPAALAEAERLGRPGGALVDGAGGGLRRGGAAGRRGAGPPGDAHARRPRRRGRRGRRGAAAGAGRGRDRPGLGVAAGLTLGTSWRTALGGATVRNAYAGVAGANGWLAVDLAVAGHHALARHAHGDLRPGQRLRARRGRGPGRARRALRGLAQLLQAPRLLPVQPPRRRCDRGAPGEDAPRAPERDRVDPRRDLGARRHDERPGPGRAARRKVLDPIQPRGPARPREREGRGSWGDCGVEAFREPALSDPRVRALARRVEVVEDPALTALTPDARPARVEVRLADGRTLARQVDQPFGEFDRPYPESVLREKFVALAGPDLGAARRRIGLGTLPARGRPRERPGADRGPPEPCALPSPALTRPHRRRALTRPLSLARP